MGENVGKVKRKKLSTKPCRMGEKKRGQQQKKVQGRNSTRFHASRLGSCRQLLELPTTFHVILFSDWPPAPPGQPRVGPPSWKMAAVHTCTYGGKLRSTSIRAYRALLGGSAVYMWKWRICWVKCAVLSMPRSPPPLHRLVPRG